MAKTPGLFHRNGTYYYRVRVPKDLVEILGKKEFKKSLNTKSYSEAKKRCKIAAVECDAVFDDARQKHSQGQVPQTKLTKAEALALSREYLIKQDQKLREMDEQTDYSESELADALVHWGITKQIDKDPNHPDTLRGTQRVAREILVDRNIELDVHDANHRLLLEYVRRAFLELSRRGIALLKQDYSCPCFDTLFAPDVSSANSYSTGKSLSEVADAYFANYVKEKFAKGISERTIKQTRATLDFILEELGSTLDIATVDAQRCRNFRDLLAEMPANPHKLYEDLSFKEIAKKAKTDGRSPMAYETQARYLQTLNRLLKWSSGEGFSNVLPSNVFTPLAKKTPDKSKRDPYSSDQLSAIFMAPLYTGCQDDELGFSKPGANVIKRHRFWLPLIGLYTGMIPVSL